jgi:hypothetical protein
MFGTWGGWIKAIGFCANEASAGLNIRSSPMPEPEVKSSTNALKGQPPPGSSAESLS